MPKPLDLLTDLAGKTMNAAHRTALKLSGGRVLSTAFGMPTVELHTTGRKSGKRRSTMLTTPLHDDDRVVLVASKGGDDRHPDWYVNLSANPEVELTIDGDTRPMRARTSSSDEKAELWPQIVAAYRGYGGYQRRTTRDIPVVILEPRTGPSSPRSPAA
jgi:deazaflavin-dependent oxidoreductase (nitroreductase family)